jgi:hypothetical protein
MQKKEITSEIPSDADHSIDFPQLSQKIFVLLSFDSQFLGQDFIGLVELRNIGLEGLHIIPTDHLI